MMVEELEKIYIDNKSKMIIYTKRKVNLMEDAEDIVQEVFLIALERQVLLENHPNLMGWLMKTLQFKIYHYYSHICEHYPSNCLEVCVYQQRKVDNRRKDYKEYAYDKTEWELWGRRILTEEEMIMFVCRDLLGYHVKELAEFYHLNEQQIRTRLCRIRKKIRENMEEQENNKTCNK